MNNVFEMNIVEVKSALRDRWGCSNSDIVTSVYPDGVNQFTATVSIGGHCEVGTCWGASSAKLARLRALQNALINS